ncbi:pyridoxamine 5'-phosphate oxidase family protein [Salarchaeum sp. JOR-1]|uniref:pyridoxamine 5'-phosphate oxidase family protein n=1 Tax=Salarchaeum sp. JOR-1 TaxID=2599399 RepID=UPI00119844E1|nr:pyridoxamine 5'-phosphate oxidase family protein [Salarchaeum sp. JOR-1]QDX39461.1 pyridoxamine 5'-phosphate oxidase family protein [Salarchaeum sp. JOR-1]
MTSELERPAVDQLLRANGTGVLALTNGTGVLALTNGPDAYSFPESFGYDGEALYFQFVYDEDSKKMAFLETTDTASFTVYTTDPPESVIVTGPIEKVPEADRTVAAAVIAENAEIPTLNTDPEKHPRELTFDFYRLLPRELSGRVFRDIASSQTRS